MYNDKQQWYLNSRGLFTLELGKEYFVTHKASPNMVVRLRLVKVTPKGFNLLNVLTGKCVLYPHIYPYKKNDSFNGYDNPMKFWLNKNWQFVKVTEKNEHIVVTTSKYISNNYV
ncbi:hypothetical protein HYO65_gp161 [Tenacibaculum phage PTm1]|uniref:Uncharacterized protein n=2 Tax=Shirahamavirus PTm1 TaxID=2846435 RepID=A0A5S9HXG4_9CAUD|nr:hypothetical protein HYO65_gp161 [Tenacibaculum phage PTm1]BBI90553.1 hypothetical protein [Tenacibaculum phage PTm1]BBI90861.1 hypothetical protein [Tenacibaculum phage PTm5]